MAGTTVTLDSSGGITLDADNGTITFADAGSSLGTITSSGYSGTAAVATAVTITDNESTNENNAIVFTAGGDVDGGDLGLEADGTAELAGTTVTLNSSGGVTLDADNGTITFADAGSSLGTITSSGYSGTAAVATTVTITDNESTNENNAIVFTAGGDLDGGNLGLEADGTLNYNPSTGTLTCTNLVTSGTHTVTNSVEMTANSTVVFEGATADAHETTLGAIDATGDRAINLPNVAGTLPVLAAVSATAITSTPEELNILDGATVVVGEINALDLGSTAVGTAIASKAVILDSNKDYTGIRNLTLAGNVVIADDGNIGSASDADAMAIASNGVVTFSQIPVMPANSIDSDEYIDGSIDTAHIADAQITVAKMAANSVNSDQYVDGSIDTAHIADLQVTGARLALDRRSAASSNDVYMGNTHDYIFADADVGLKFFTANGEDMRLLDDGTLHVDGDVIAFSSTISDERLKENIEVVDDALEKVEQLNGCTFTYKEDGRKSAGVIAQDVQKVLPCAVQSLDLPYQGEEDEDYLTVNYDSLNALLIESIKELSSKVKELEKKLEEK